MASIEPADWEARAAHIRQSIPADQLSDTSLALVLNAFLLADDGGRVWAFNGFSWSAWDGQQWAQSTPPAQLQLQPFAPADTSDDTATSETATSPAGLATAEAEPEPMAMAEPEPMAMAEPEPEAEPESVSFEQAIAADDEPPAAVSQATETPATPMAEPERVAAAQPWAATTPTPMTQATTAPVPAAPATTAPAPSAPAAPAGGEPARPSEPAQWPTPQAAPAFQYRATHAVPPPGMAAWSRPDPTIAPEFRLWPGLDVMVVEWLPSGWARVVTSNQWSGWVDGRMLQPYR